jgi:hypothetical protein
MSGEYGVFYVGAPWGDDENGELLARYGTLDEAAERIRREYRNGQVIALEITIRRMALDGTWETVEW